jgi:gamma-glutamyltranspeptidase / glutathione hydrolase
VTAFDWRNPYPSVRSPVFARNVVATSQPLAAQAGLQMLWRGGNAVDAAIAAAAALTVVEPVSCGLGGDAFALVWHRGELHGLNASGHAPAGWSPEYFQHRYGQQGTQVQRPLRGWDTVTVPGVIAGWQALHQRFGSLPMAALLAPAIELAESGHAVACIVSHKWQAAVPELREQPGFAETFMPGGRAPLPGELVRLPALAGTLRALAECGARDFYEGAIAARIVSAARTAGAAMTLDDLRSYQPEWVRPLALRYRGYAVYELPPNGQGIAALMALGMLSHHDLSSLPVDSAGSQHLQIEAMKLAFADLYRYVGDPRSMPVAPSQLLDSDYLRGRAALIDPRRAATVNCGRPPGGGTIYMSAADQHGTMVSFIQSNYMGFGSGVVVPGTGISMHNRGLGFTLDPLSPNVVGGRKRPFHTIIPAFLTQQHGGITQPVMSFGVMGGDMQPQGHLQTLVRMIDYAQQPQAACDAPRWKLNPDSSLAVEPHFDAQALAGLRTLGHAIRPFHDSYMDFGSGQFVCRLDPNDADRGYVAASDSRRDGLAAGF